MAQEERAARSESWGNRRSESQNGDFDLNSFLLDRPGVLRFRALKFLNHVVIYITL